MSKPPVPAKPAPRPPASGARPAAPRPPAPRPGSVLPRSAPSSGTTANAATAKPPAADGTQKPTAKVAVAGAFFSRDTRVAQPPARKPAAPSRPAAKPDAKPDPKAPAKPDAKAEARPDAYRIPSGLSNTDAPPVRKRRSLRRFWIYVAACLVAGAVIAMVFLGIGIGAKAKFALPKAPNFAYTLVGPIHMAGTDYKLVVAAEIQVDKKDLEWAQQNTYKFYKILEEDLLTIDPRIAQKPDGLPKLQRDLRELINQRMQVDRIQQVWITEFAYLPDTYYEH